MGACVCLRESGEGVCFRVYPECDDVSGVVTPLHTSPSKGSSQRVESHTLNRPSAVKQSQCVRLNSNRRHSPTEP